MEKQSGSALEKGCGSAEIVKEGQVHSVDVSLPKWTTAFRFANESVNRR